MPREKKQKGLTDKELIEKYEAGKVDMDKAIHEMLDKPPVAPKTEKQTTKKHSR